MEDQSKTADAVLVDVTEVARMLGVCKQHVRRLADSGRMPAPRRLGQLVRWSKAEILKWCADGCPRVRPLRRVGR